MISLYDVQKERRFEKKMKKKGLMIKKMRDDGACLFRAVADQVYGDQDMHGNVRQQCMDYIVSMQENLFKFLSLTVYMIHIVDKQVMP